MYSKYDNDSILDLCLSVQRVAYSVVLKQLSMWTFLTDIFK